MLGSKRSLVCYNAEPSKIDIVLKSVGPLCFLKVLGFVLLSIAGKETWAGASRSHPNKFNQCDNVDVLSCMPISDLENQRQDPFIATNMLIILDKHKTL